MTLLLSFQTDVRSMQAASHLLGRGALLGTSSANGGRRSTLPRGKAAVTVRAALGSDSHEQSPREKAAVLLTGLAAATCLALGPSPAHAEGPAAPAATAAAAAPAPVAAAAAPKPAAAAAPAAAPKPADSKPAEAKAEAKPAEAKAEAKPAEAKTSEAKAAEPAKAEVEKPKPKPALPQNPETQQLFADLEASKATAIKTVEGLQAKLADEHSKVEKLKAEVEAEKKQIAALKVELGAAQKEVDRERQELVVAKKETAAKAAEAEAAAARAVAAEDAAARAKASAEKMRPKSVQDVIDAVKAKDWGLAGPWLWAAGGWSSATILGLVAVAQASRSSEEEVTGQAGEGASLNALRARATAEAEGLRREVTSLQGDLAKVRVELKDERSKSTALRETILLLEGEVSRMEGGMNAAKSEAFELQRKLSEVLDEVSRALRESAAPKGAAPAPVKKPLDVKAPSAAGSSLTTTTTSLSSKESKETELKESKGKAGGVKVKFSVQQELPFGQSLALVGSHPSLGAWDERKGPKLTWGEGHVWTAEVSLPAGTATEFKCVRTIDGQEGGGQWEEGRNHVLLVPAAGVSSMLVTVDWGQGTAVKLPEQKAPVPKQKDTSGKSGGGSNGASVNGNGNGNGHANDSVNGNGKKALAGVTSNRWMGLM